MGIRECYQSFGGDYEDVRKRLPKEELILRFVMKFLEDDSFARLRDALEARDYGEAFQAAHSLKGVSRNLSFRRLSASSDALTELLRHREQEPVDETLCAQLFSQVQTDYEKIVAAVRQLNER